jgi:hypothetical protein
MTEQERRAAIGRMVQRMKVEGQTPSSFASNNRGDELVSSCLKIS